MRRSQSTIDLKDKETNAMKQQNANNQSDKRTNQHAQTVQALETNRLHDLPVNEAQQAAIKGGPVAVEYLVLPGVVAPPAGTITSRP
jgi:hypothetical protein